ncbi:26S proteasome non-ATPase regulatory subunit 4-like [Senna tora]|uniref:26S proteasome non-ATPase regulatory subunit 4-like n=1 Tax=Senna tora TaxID=362788 RepID=A0A834WXG3_9FABA|nr:26S proteasome non-ATPase regulatory subunit 4-like [Senna tora]
MGDLLGSPRVAPLFFFSYPVRRWHKGNVHARHDGCDHTSTNAPDPIRTPKLSVLGRRVVLGWVTSWEVLVLHPFFFFRTPYGDGIRGMYTRDMTGAIIPALMHRIPSELRS